MESYGMVILDYQPWNDVSWKILTFPSSKSATQELFFHFKLHMPPGLF